ncbi:MAG: hypothetical protein AAF236_03125 [Verrucomicrobiota bacterium]
MSDSWIDREEFEELLGAVSRRPQRSDRKRRSEPAKALRKESVSPAESEPRSERKFVQVPEFDEPPSQTVSEPDKRKQPEFFDGLELGISDERGSESSIEQSLDREKLTPGNPDQSEAVTVNSLFGAGSEEFEEESVDEDEAEVAAELPVDEDEAEVAAEVPVDEDEAEVLPEVPVDEDEAEVVTEALVGEDEAKVAAEVMVDEDEAEVVAEALEPGDHSDLSPIQSATEEEESGASLEPEDDTEIVNVSVEPTRDLEAQSERTPRFIDEINEWMQTVDTAERHPQSAKALAQLAEARSLVDAGNLLGEPVQRGGAETGQSGDQPSSIESFQFPEKGFEDEAPIPSAAGAGAGYSEDVEPVPRDSNAGEPIDVSGDFTEPPANAADQPTPDPQTEYPDLEPQIEESHSLVGMPEPEVPPAFAAEEEVFEETDEFSPAYESIGFSGSLKERLATFAELAMEDLGATGVHISDNLGHSLFSTGSSSQGASLANRVGEAGARLIIALGMPGPGCSQVSDGGDGWLTLILGWDSSRHIFALFEVAEPLDQSSIVIWRKALAEALNPEAIDRLIA